MERSSRLETVAHSSLWLPFGTVSPFRPHRQAGSVESSLGSLAARVLGERRQGRSCQGLATVRSTERQCGLVMCRIILCSVRRSNHCYWHSHHLEAVAPERYKEGAHLRITMVSTSVAKCILNFLSQYKYSASGILPFFGRVPKPSKSDY
jgi:hypothetical protein